MSKFLGQHFLKNSHAIQAALKALKLKRGDFVIEIGSGKGALTRPLLQLCQQKGAKLIALEKDRRLALRLYSEFKGNKNVEILAKDVLKELPSLTKKIKGNYHLLGNIPYYISGKLLRTLSELEHKPKSSILMLQKEVADRVNAKTGDMTLLAAIVQFFANPKILFQLKEGDFQPAPKVRSSLVLLQAKGHKQSLAKPYYKFVKIAFKQPRKTLLNNLEGAGFPKESSLKILRAQKLKTRTRAHELSQKKIQNLAVFFTTGSQKQSVVE